VIIRSSLVAVALLLIAAPSWAANPLMPDPALSPAEVVSIQLNALLGVDAGLAEADDRVGAPGDHPHRWRAMTKAR
jgi:hypothetical protein